MSLILDALQRSREDSSAVPDLATRHAYPVQAPGRPWLVFALGAALLGCLVVLLWLVWDRGQESPATGVGSAPAASVTTGTPSASQAAAVPEPVSQASLSQATVTAGVPAPAQDAAAAPVEVEPAASGADADPAVSALYRSQSEAVRPAAGPDTAAPAPVASAPSAATAPAPAAEQAVDIEAMVRKAESELADARLAEHPAPFVNELSQRTKDGIPTIYYQRHEYSGQAGQSRVVLNGKSLKTGGSPIGGMRVAEILPDSVVLEYQGTQFRLRALNSWVNL